MPIREITDPFRLEDIVPYFQPIVDLRTDRVWRYECLARLVTEPEKVYLPNEFLYLVERHNHVQQLTETMFAQCAKFFANKNLSWNINLDLADLHNPALLSFFSQQLSAYCNPGRVCVEVSAQSAISDLAQFGAFVDAIQPSGIGVFVDNVGRVPGNIKRLLELPLRGIKLDGGLLRHYQTTPAVQEFISYVCEQAHEQRISVVAEQVEDLDILEIVHHLPIDYAQGFVFSTPKPTLAD
ncbi:EAL domain-containing protein [Salinimonas sediminis]|uniref:EAL domain-containing protein n=1 Tax=Salinimonas sediminis TaxID=2303538 RepID=A0A346NR07_9ALTE|nr:EAL domain-containing protein [Salinimonas sediminis]AXR07964.1 EAL domain-containing protein [Salinimonas sediminis]